ncbi:hypothetical protein FRC17_010837 [Serendipita sp. 399]|nr:hypothetical protein FRC17_010837 [Serendipita sp. 399]
MLPQSHSLLLLLSLLSAPFVVLAANFDVNVGNTGLNFTPDHVKDAKAGDTVTFHFISGTHTVTQSTLEAPCTQRGFDSGVVDDGGTYQIKLNSTDPVWIFCASRGHCQAGMVFAVNPGDKLSQFQNTASGIDTLPTLSPSSITDSFPPITTTTSSSTSSGLTTRVTGTDNGTITRTSSASAANVSSLPQNNGAGLSTRPGMLMAMVVITLLSIGIVVA